MGSIRNLSGHTAIVTGAAGGIGLSFCRVLAAAGCSLLLVDISASRLDETKAALSAQYPGVAIHILVCDLTSADAVKDIDSFCASEELDPDILINNAGIFSFSPLTDVPDKKIECFIQLHVGAVTRLSRWMAARRASNGSGWILNMSSMSCWMPMPGLSLYAATKAYIRVLSRSLAYEMKDSGVKVMAACPGGIATDLFGLPENLKRLAVGIGALQTPDAFARKAISRLFKGKHQYINGLINRISILFVGMTPTPVRMMVKHRLLDRGITR